MSDHESDSDDMVRWPPATGAEAERQSMSKLRRALLKRREHQAHARAWEAADNRNHFGPSIEIAMQIGRDNANR